VRILLNECIPGASAGAPNEDVFVPVSETSPSYSSTELVLILSSSNFGSNVLHRFNFVSNFRLQTILLHWYVRRPVLLIVSTRYPSSSRSLMGNAHPAAVHLTRQQQFPII